MTKNNLVNTFFQGNTFFFLLLDLNNQKSKSKV